MCRLATETRSNSPSNANRYHHSPTRPRPNPPPDDRKPVDKTSERHGEQPKAARKNTDVNGSNASSHDLRNGVGAEIPKSRPSQGETLEKHLRSDKHEKHHSPDRKNHMSPNVDLCEKKVQSGPQDGDKKKGALHSSDSSACNLPLRCHSGWRFFFFEVSLPFDRIRGVCVRGESGGRHDQRRGGYQVTGRAKASGSSSERTGRQKAGAGGRRAVSLWNERCGRDAATIGP